MAAATSFSSRRSAAGQLPSFHLPPPSSDIPRAGDGISPSLSSVNTGSSQSSQTTTGMYTYGGIQANWPASGASSYNLSSTAQPQPHLGQSSYNSRPSIYGQPSSMSYSHPRNSHSPATGSEALPPPPFDQVHPPFSAPLSAGGGQGNPQSMSTGSQLPTASSASSHFDSYSHSRPPNHASYYATSPTSQQPAYPAYTTQPSPTQLSPTSSGPGMRGMSALAGQHQLPVMAPPVSYRYPFPTGSSGSAPLLSNMHHAGAPLGTVLPGMGAPQTYQSHLAYGHTPPTPQNERPFRCDHCVQSFSRNHDLKRHKRIHLSVKPFQCTVCMKSFSRKDALKRHRLVKGCDKISENNNEEGYVERKGDADESPVFKQEHQER